MFVIPIHRRIKLIFVTAVVSNPSLSLSTGQSNAWCGPQAVKTLLPPNPHYTMRLFSLYEALYPLEMRVPYSGWKKNRSNVTADWNLLFNFNTLWHCPNIVTALSIFVFILNRYPLMYTVHNSRCRKEKWRLFQISSSKLCFVINVD